MRNKKEKPEDFIGWKSEDGKLEVIGIADKKYKNGRKLYKVTCTECSKDHELFPDGYFIAQKQSLKNNSKPCGCSNFKYSPEQYLIKITRVVNGKFIVRGLAEDFNGHRTKLDCECIIDGFKWTPKISTLLSKGTGCPKCGGTLKTTKEDALSKCINVCEQEGYTPIGFVGEHENAYSRFEYICKEHGIQNISYHNFVNRGRRCRSCAVDRGKESGIINGFYPDKFNEIDFLYVTSFDNKYAKIGRSFNVEKRAVTLQQRSKCEKLTILRVYTAPHKTIYELEQYLHKELRRLGFEYKDSHWPTETFRVESLHTAFTLLNSSEHVKTYDLEESL